MTCAGCGAELGRLVIVRGTGEPANGDFLVCDVCKAALVWDAEVRLMTAHEFESLDEGDRIALERVRKGES